jgi:ABC-type multidrug transport system fused ATPase/permease subunit
VVRLGWHRAFEHDGEGDRGEQYLTDGQKVRRLVKQVMAYRMYVAVVVLSIFVSSTVSMLAPYVLGVTVDRIVGRNFLSAMYAALIYLSLYVVNYAAENRRSFYVPYVSQMVVKKLRDSCFETLQRVSVTYFTQREAGQIISRVTNDAEALSEFLTFQLPAVLSGMTGVVASIAIMVYLDPSLTLVSVSVIPLLALFTFAIQGRVRRNFLETRRKIAVVTARLQEAISGIRVIKAFSKEGEMANRFDVANIQNMNANIKANRLTATFNSSVQLIEAAGIALVLYFGAHQVLSGAITIGLLVSFVAYVQGFFNPVLQLSQFYNSYQSAMVGLDRIYRLVDTPADKDEGLIPVEVIRGEVEFQNVSFSYDGKNEVLHDVSFVVPAGKKVAIVGETGAGKSTIVGILLKFYQPTGGRVLVDGYDLSKMKTVDYRKRISVILQEPFLLNATVIDNIRLGNPMATRGSVEEILRRVGLEDVFAMLPEGLDTVITEMGANLSEGQKQLVSFVRALVRDPCMIIMDEATSQIDSYTEAKLREAMKRGFKGRTVITIAHRLSTVVDSDLVVFVKSGRIAEIGSPYELLKGNGQFSGFFRSQRP